VELSFDVWFSDDVELFADLDNALGAVYLWVCGHLSGRFHGGLAGHTGSSWQLLAADWWLVSNCCAIADGTKAIRCAKMSSRKLSCRMERLI